MGFAAAGVVLPGVSTSMLRGIEKAAEAVKAEGTVYRRTNAANPAGKPYIGRAKSETRYEKRQGEHGRANPDADYQYEEVERAEPGQALREAEQRQIDANGGPTNQSNPNGGTSNRRNEIAKPKCTKTGSRIPVDC